MIMLLRTLFVFVVFVLASCGGGGSSPTPSPLPIPSPTPAPSPMCSRAQLATELDEALSLVDTDVDFSLYLENGSAENYTFERGSSTLTTPYESASTSKWVSASVILWLVDKGSLALEDQPQDYLNSTEWPINSGDSLSAITLSQLLSFSSGLEEEALCLNAGGFDFFDCVRNIALINANNGRVPGEAFFYSSSHLQVAGAMALRAGGFNSWQALFDAFRSETTLFPNSNYNLPSISNPRLAGGMTWTAQDYADFLRAYKNSDVLLPETVALASSDQTANATIAYSPAFSGIGEDWHYGYGQWIECHSASYDCADISQVSSPGAYGAYPFINWAQGYFGILAREGALGSFREGYAVFDQVRSEVEAWATCANP